MLKSRGILAVPVGAFAAGDETRALLGIFPRFQGGRIVVEQHNYGFEDFLTPKA
jgi:hypothetical protein